MPTEPYRAEVTGTQARLRLGCWLLVLLAAVLGVRHVVTTVLVSRDGVTFIEMARGLRVAPWTTLQQNDQHPGYPWLIGQVHRLTAGSGRRAEGVRAWTTAAQLTSLLARLGTVALLVSLAARWLPATDALWGGLLWVMLPKPAAFGADALSDWPALLCWVAGLGALAAAARRRPGWMGFAAGLAAGLGYWIRPECAELVVIGSAWMATRRWWDRRPGPRRRVAAALVGLWVGFLGPAAPYMVAKQAVFPKKHIAQWSAREVAAVPAAPRVSWPRAVVRLVDRVGDTVRWFPLPLMVLGMMHLGRRGALAALAWATMAVHAAVLLWLVRTYGYLDNRHVLALLIWPVLAAPAGLRTALGRWTAGRPWAGRHETLAAAVLLAVLACLTPRLLRPLHADKQSVREAADWIRMHTAPGTRVAAPDRRVAFYAERPAIEPEDAGPGDLVVRVVGPNEPGAWLMETTRPGPHLVCVWVQEP